MLVDYISCLKEIEAVCTAFQRSIENIFFKHGKAKHSITPYFQQTPDYLEKFNSIRSSAELCRILKLPFGDFEHSFWNSITTLENPYMIIDLEQFRLSVQGAILGFARVQEQISGFCKAFDEEEKQRINEAIHNFFEGCNYSCVAMSVSAAEARLLKLMCIVAPDSANTLCEMTLGELMREYVTNKAKYKNVVPQKHEHLLRLCNTYRIFSVHPKKESISGLLTNSILSLVLEFLTDKDTKPEVVKTRENST